MHELGDPPNPVPACSTLSATQSPAEKVATSLYIGGRMPPIPAKLAKRIQDGQFVEMVELLPDLLRGYNPSDEDQLKSSKSKYRESQITNIIDWIQCFSLYIAIICRTQPQRTVDLLGYQNLIITSHQRFPDFNWATYDREFRQQAAASAVSEWSVLDNTLWNLARQSTAHPSKIQFTTYPSRSQYIEQSSRSQFSSSPSQFRKARVCLDWNESPATGCPHPICRYEHICYRCINIPSIPDKHHKAIHCPNKAQPKTRR